MPLLVSMSGSPEQLPQPAYRRRPGRAVIDSVYHHPMHWLDSTPIHRRPPDLITDIRHRVHLYKRRKQKDPRRIHEPYLVEREVPATVRKFDGIYFWRSVAASALATAIVYPLFHFTLSEGGNNPAQGADKSQGKLVTLPLPELIQDTPRSITVTFRTGKETAAGEKRAEQQFVQQLQKDVAHGEILTEGTAVGYSSPDWIGPIGAVSGARSLTVSGRDNAQNYALSEGRVNGLLRGIAAEAAKPQQGVVLPEITVHAEVSGLTKQQQRKLTGLLARHGETLSQNFGQLFYLYDNHPKQLSPDLREAMDVIIGKTRSATVTIEREHVVFPPAFGGTGPEPSPPPPHHSEIPIPLPIPLPVPRTRKEEGTITIRTPELLTRNLPNPMWVWLYPEAKIAPDALAENTFLYTRLGQILLREDRIQKVMTQTYQDDTDTEQKLQALFIDHVPTEGAKEYIRQVMQRLSYALGGKVGYYLDHIGVYPKETAGRSPRQVGLGIDHQEDRNVVGLAIPLLRYAEILAPREPTEKDFANIDNFVGTLVHELAGHYGDRNNEPIKITPINEHKNTYYSNNPWANTAMEIADKYPDPQEMPVHDLEFEITLIEPGQGEVRYLVRGDDPRLAQARSARLMNAAPTSYGASHYLELFAEAARQVVSGKVFSFENAGIHIQRDGTEVPGVVAQGYAVSHELQQLVANRLGATAQGQGLAWPEDTVRKRLATTEFVETTVAEDPDMVAMAEYARSTAQPRKRKMIKVLTSSSGLIAGGSDLL